VGMTTGKANRLIFNTWLGAEKRDGFYL
jgi:hypothetical protein